MSRLIASLFVVAFAGTALASPPEIVGAVIEQDSLLLTLCKQVPVEKTLTVEVIENGVKVQKVQKVTSFESVTVVEKTPLARVKATSVAGNPIAPETLKNLLKTERLVVVSRGDDVPESYRKLFKDDVVFLQIETAKK